MQTFDTATWFAVTLIGGCGLVGGLYALARHAERERKLVDLRRQVGVLRNEHEERIAEMTARERGDPMKFAPLPTNAAAESAELKNAA